MLNWPFIFNYSLDSRWKEPTLVPFNYAFEKAQLIIHWGKGKHYTCDLVILFNQSQICDIAYKIPVAWSSDRLQIANSEWKF